MKYYLKCWRHYADFKGRATRTEYWMFALFDFVATIVCLLLDYAIGRFWIEDADIAFSIAFMDWDSLLISFSMAYLIASYLPWMTVTVRRLHDIGVSGWYYLASFVPYIGGVLILIMACQDSQAKANRWGECPKLTKGGAEKEEGNATDSNLV